MLYYVFLKLKLLNNGSVFVNTTVNQLSPTDRRGYDLPLCSGRRVSSQDSRTLFCFAFYEEFRVSSRETLLEWNQEVPEPKELYLVVQHFVYKQLVSQTIIEMKSFFCYYYLLIVSVSFTKVLMEWFTFKPADVPHDPFECCCISCYCE